MHRIQRRPPGTALAHLGLAGGRALQKPRPQHRAHAGAHAAGGASLHVGAAVPWAAARLQQGAEGGDRGPWALMLFVCGGPGASSLRQK